MKITENTKGLTGSMVNIDAEELRQIKTKLDQYRWRDVKEELPEDCGVDLGDFIIMFDSGIDAISLAVYWCCRRKQFIHNGKAIDNNDVMAWMPLPRFEVEK